MTQFVLRAPAKLNLGLEILGRRADGYHEIATIMLAVSVADRLVASPADELTLTVSDPRLDASDNLVLHAVQRLRDVARVAMGAAIHLDKAIPVAAGLGGASSDAAAALRLASRLWDTRLQDGELHAIGASLGSDVPFFLQTTTALARGKGEQLTSLGLRAPSWFVIVSPFVEFPRKTATLYAALSSDDFSSGADVIQHAAHLRAGGSIEPSLLGNAFLRPLLAIRPELASLAQDMKLAGAPFVALSGAGPSHYTAFDDANSASEFSRDLRRRLGPSAIVAVCSPLAQLPDIETVVS